MTTTFVLRGPIARREIPALCVTLRRVLAVDPGPIVFDIRRLVDPDATTVEALARLQLSALRLGHRIRLRNACGELEDLLALVGLVELLPVIASPVSASTVRPTLSGSRLESIGQSEEREQMRRVEEERDPVDPVA